SSIYKNLKLVGVTSLVTGTGQSWMAEVVLLPDGWYLHAKAGTTVSQYLGPVSTLANGTWKDVTLSVDSADGSLDASVTFGPSCSEDAPTVVTASHTASATYRRAEFAEFMRREFTAALA